MSELRIAPAILWHEINGRLTNNDIGQTICGKDNIPLGIYMGVWAPEWAKSQEIRTYAAITDARDWHDHRLSKTFREYVTCLKKQQDGRNDYENGEKLSDHPFYARNRSYEMAMQDRILKLKPGEYTGQMIPPNEILCGQKHPGDEVTHPNNMYALRHKEDFTKANNGGYDSRFETEHDFGNAHWYVSSTEGRKNQAFIRSTDFSDGDSVFIIKADTFASLRPFIVERPKP